MTLLVAVAVLVAAAVDPASARAVARRNEEMLAQGEAALARGDAHAALTSALAVTTSDRRLARPRHLLLRGRARAASGLADDAVADLRAARADLDDGAPVWVTVTREIARVERSRAAFDACADELLAAERRAPAGDDDAVLLATCLRGTTRTAQAHDALDARVSAEARSLRARIRLEDGLPRLARQDVEALATTLPVHALLSFATAFRAAGDAQFAGALVDAAVARAPDDPEVAAALADAAPGGAGALRAARVQPGLAERLRIEGKTRDAWNAALIDDGGARLRNRLALLVEERAWDRVRSLAPRLRASGLFDDDAAYAVAYAALATGHLDEADAALDVTSGAAAFARATELRAAVAACRAARRSDDPLQQERACSR
ncbi:MAG: hypothetical protein FJ137_14850 [Deltaproteobacteria bacterium]|nr:hypothetical protein [Deltaproteobacteria bacterium]